MAKVIDVFVTGGVGNVILYRRMGTNCSRAKRLHLRQTGATITRSVNFGIAAKAGKGLRSGLTPCMPLPRDRSMQSRFSGAIAKWLGLSAIDELKPAEMLPFLSSFEFTKEQPVHQGFKVPLTFRQVKQDVIGVSTDCFVPAKEISAPAGTGLVTLVISAASCLLKTGEPLAHETHTIDIPYNDTTIVPKVLEFHVSTPPQSLLVIAARLIYKKFDYDGLPEIKKDTFMPAGVIYAAYR